MRDTCIFYQHENSDAHVDIDRRYYKDFCFNKHIHANPEFIYVTGGELMAEIAGHVMTIGANQFCLVLPWQIHAFYTPDTSQCVILVVSSYYVDNFVKNIAGWRGKNQVFTADPPIRDLFMQYLYEGSFPDEYIISSTLLALCHCFYRQCPLEQVLDENKSSAMQSIMNYISKNYATILSLKDLCNKVGYSYSHISHLFSAYMGMSFPKFLSMTRLNHARYLLLHTNSSITVICNECGFSSPRCFNRIFHESIHMTPTEYRYRFSLSKDADRISINEGIVQAETALPIRQGIT